jgi:hypothetical protein
MEIEYNKLKQIAADVRAELVIKGKIDITTGKIRKKPRTREKENLLFTIAIDRITKYKPRIEGNKIILPYFFNSA